MNEPEAMIGDWDPEEFEQNGRELLARIRIHQETIRDQPVTSNIDAAQLKDLFSVPLPEGPTDFKSILDDTWEKVVPHLTHWHHPSFHAYFSNSSSGPGILAETLTAALNVNGMLWKSAPSAAAVEQAVLSWMAQMIGYPEGSDGVLVNGASLATLYALAAARDSVPDIQVREQGLAGRNLPRLRLYTSDQAHSSIEKAAIALGIGTDNVVCLTSDGDGCMPPTALREAIRKDLQRGWLPFAVIATTGTTSTGAIDPLPGIAEVCEDFKMWLHVDAAYGGFFHLVDALRPKLDHYHLADSIVVNPHKVLFSPMEVTALYSKRTGALSNTFRLVPEYLRVAPDDAAIDYMNYSLQLGRQFRALKVWWIIRAFGREGLAARLKHAVDLANWLREQAREHSHWQVPAASELPLVCLRYEPDVPPGELPPSDRKRWFDELNEIICTLVNQSGRAYISHAVTPAGYILRVSVGNIQTTCKDIEGLWEILNIAAIEAHRRLLERA